MDWGTQKLDVMAKLIRLIEDCEAGKVLPVRPHTQDKFIQYVKEFTKKLGDAEITDFNPPEPGEHQQGVAVPKGVDLAKARTDFYDFRFKYRHTTWGEARHETFDVTYRRLSEAA